MTAGERNIGGYRAPLLRLIRDRSGGRREVKTMIGFRVALLLLVVGLLGANAGLATRASAAKAKPAARAAGTKTAVLEVTGMT